MCSTVTLDLSSTLHQHIELRFPIGIWIITVYVSKWPSILKHSYIEYYFKTLSLSLSLSLFSSDLRHVTCSPTNANSDCDLLQHPHHACHECNRWSRRITATAVQFHPSPFCSYCRQASSFCVAWHQPCFTFRELVHEWVTNKKKNHRCLLQQ